VEEAPSEEAAWHSSERGELQVAFLAPASADHPGGLRVTPPGGAGRELHYRADGSFGAAPDGAAEGRWQLWPDGSLELILEGPGRVLRERIWFTQPNLRLRSSVEHRDGGRPGRARFSSEIRSWTALALQEKGWLQMVVWDISRASTRNGRKGS
jgi:hypothetical protein